MPEDINLNIEDEILHEKIIAELCSYLKKRKKKSLYLQVLANVNVMIESQTSVKCKQKNHIKLKLQFMAYFVIPFLNYRWAKNKSCKVSRGNKPLNLKVVLLSKDFQTSSWDIIFAFVSKLTGKGKFFLKLFQPRYLEYYRYFTIMFFGIKTNNLFIG